jgi:hypothetical protein
MRRLVMGRRSRIRRSRGCRSKSGEQIGLFWAVCS